MSQIAWIIVALLALLLVIIWAWWPLRKSERVQLRPFQEKINADRSISSWQEASFLPQGDWQSIWSEAGLERTGRAYWLFLARTSLGLIHVRYKRDGRKLKLGPFTLLYFDPPEYYLDDHSGSIIWPIKGGLLDKKPGGSLRISLTQGQKGWLNVTVTVERFQPRLPQPLYRRSEAIIHVIMTRAFLRSLAHSQLPYSAVGRFDQTDQVSHDNN